MADTAALQWRVREILRRYTVRTHYAASAESRARRYAVFADGQQVGEPASHGDAHAAREKLMLADLMTLIEGESQ